MNILTNDLPETVPLGLLNSKPPLNSMWVTCTHRAICPTEQLIPVADCFVLGSPGVQWKKYTQANITACWILCCEKRVQVRRASNDCCTNWALSKREKQTTTYSRYPKADRNVIPITVKTNPSCEVSTKGHLQILFTEFEKLWTSFD